MAPLFSRRKPPPALGVTQPSSTHRAQSLPNQDAYFHFTTAVHSLAGVFDGHGPNGAVIAHLAARHTRDRLAGDLPRADAQSYKSVLRAALRAAAAMVEREKGSDTSGCTGSVVMVGRGEMIVAALGDVEVVVAGAKGTYSSRLEAKWRSGRHGVAVDDERQRVVDAGGQVVQDYVLDKLDKTKGIKVTRVIGDTDMRRNGIISEPEIWTVPITKLDRYVLVATDGLWDCDVLLNLQGVCDIVAKSARESGSVQDILNRLMARVAENGMTDDCTIVCIKL